jgi:hypothetical protein
MPRGEREKITLKWLSSRSINWIHNKTIGGFRPDFYKDYGKYVVVIEVDEWAHSDKDPFIEHIRMIKIREAFAKPTVFIRLNTDVKYFRRKRITYKFILEEMNLRLKKLNEILASLVVDSELTVIWLFYDRFTKFFKKSWNITSYEEFIKQLYDKIDCYNHGPMDSLPEYIRLSTSNRKKQRLNTRIIQDWLKL